MQLVILAKRHVEINIQMKLQMTVILSKDTNSVGINAWFLSSANVRFQKKITTDD